ncbi:hypothetical protein [Haloferula rosea]|uniref:Uncharacterized protein n=1 Tax=Haloferula rosea TaxID=490093 RepID=A0A934R9D0_9BACT|nr:hypothetical protein [Haloferula rosea]MBK1826388.1 hypothetical protein [Haloferula rosea]
MNLISRVSLPPPYRPSPWAELMVTAVNAGCLWWFTWMQMVAAWIYGVPGFSGGRSSIISLVFYEPAGDFPWSLAGIFLVLSVLLAVFCLMATYQMVRGKPGSSRMMAVVGFFAVILLGFSCYVQQGQKRHVEALEWYIRTEDELGGEWYGGEWDKEREFLREAIKRHRQDMGED